MSKGKVRKPTKKELEKMERLDLSKLPALRFRLKALNGDNIQVGSFVMENINVSQLVFLRLPEGAEKEDMSKLVDNRVALEKYGLDKQFIVYLSHDVEVLELEAVPEEDTPQ